MNTRANSGTPDPQAAHLDNEIASIRTESKHPAYHNTKHKAERTNSNKSQVQNLKRRKRFLSSSLLASKNIQPLLSKPLTSLHTELSPLAEAADTHSETNHYRIAFGTTAFPFKDPSPSAPSENLLGIRIDVSTRNGRFAKPYYVLLRRERVKAQAEKQLRVHRHTIPGFISVAKLEGFYLPSAFAGRGVEVADSEGSEEEAEAETGPMKQKKVSVRRQDLRGFVRELRRELTAWHLRCDAVDLLRERLGLSEDENSGSGSRSGSADRLSPESKAGIVSLAATTSETRYVRLEWEDGRVGRFKLTNTGVVERAVVIGDLGRDKQVEDAMTGAGGRIESLLERLRKHAPSPISP
ncbi:Centromere protein Cenp-O [Penicillium angulare]|uniref:Centromere protein Cenp-O n=1 Tax=Penicillium angulare TaxID=116970 RepID=A0A9W9KR52_9EURO|nr:Centromere protein Cenp-O [Penicillium angulare]